MDSKDKKVRKRLERATKKKTWRDNLCASIRQVFVACSTIFLLSGSALLSCPPILALSSRPGLPTPSLFCLFMPVLLFCLRSPTLSSFHLLLLALLSRSSVLTLLSLPMLALSFFLVPALTSCSMLGPALTWLTSSTLKRLKRALSNEPLSRQSTSPNPPKPLYLFPILGPLLEKSNCKRLFDMTFINSRPLAANHITKEVDLSYGECGCPAQVKLNRSWQLKLLDCKPIYIMEVIPLVAALFWDPLFTLCLCHTIKLA